MIYLNIWKEIGRIRTEMLTSCDDYGLIIHITHDVIKVNTTSLLLSVFFMYLVYYYTSYSALLPTYKT